MTPLRISLPPAVAIAAILIVAAIALWMGIASPPLAQYFPPSFRTTQVWCEPVPQDPEPFKRLIFEDYESDLYTGILRNAGEAPVWLASGWPAGKTSSTVRLTWAGPFSHPLVARVDRPSGKPAHLTAVVLSGHETQPGVVARRVVRDLTAEETRQLEALLAHTASLGKVSVGCGPPPDGAARIVETNGPGGYHYAIRWSDEGEVSELALYMFHLTGWPDEVFWSSK